MPRTRRILIGTASALALAALPVNLASLATGSLEAVSAFAKGGEGGGHGGGDHGGGGGHGHSGEHGKSGAHGGSGSSAKSAGHGRTSVTTEKLHGAKGKGTAGSKLAKASSRKKTDLIETAALPEEAPLHGPKAKNLNARLAGLNSLNRNFHAYLVSQDPRMAKIRDFVMASANLDIANANLEDAQTAFDKAVAGLQKSYPDTAAVNPTVGGLEAFRATLDPVLDAAEIAAIDDVLKNEGGDLTTAETKADLATVGTDETALREALLDAANKNRVAQYGDDYLNDDVMKWAREVLGVGDAVGKIDEVRETLPHQP